MPTVVRTVILPRLMFAAGETLTPDGRYLLVAAGSGAVVIDVAAAESGGPHAVLGVLSSGPSGGRADAIEVSTSPDGRYAFVSREYTDVVAVFDLQQAIASHFATSGFVGSIPLGQAVVGSAFSPDGRWLYVTSELASNATDTTQSSVSGSPYRSLRPQPKAE
ncbi:MAG: beta-propeller fold lactonase family protein, partial [Mycobacteriales bacterium]